MMTSTGVTQSPDYQRNRDAMLALIRDLRDIEARAEHASNQRRETFMARGQLTPHDRLHTLLDPGMPFLRLHALANYLVEDTNPDTSVPGGSIIAGIGFVNGIRCMVWIDDSGIRAGAMTKSSLPIALSILDIALKHKLPLIHCVESAGANLVDYTVEGWAQGGMIFRNLARLSAAGIPTIAVLHGPSTAGGAYMPGLSDYVIGVKHNGLAALAGAALVRAATGEIAEDRTLGGSEMHASTTGLVEYLAEDDRHALAMARDLVARLDWNHRLHPLPPRSVEPPRLAIDELVGLVPVDHRVAYDVREVLGRLVDGSSFDEFKPLYGPATVCVHASIMGHPCGVIGNNGPLDPNGATKATHFFQLCDQSDLPVIFLNNITGYMVGTEYEQAGMIKHGAKMIQAVSNLRVPKITLYIGASFGAGNYGMCGMAYEPDFLFAWPNATTGVMGGEQAAKTMSYVARVAAERKGVPLDEAQLAAQEQHIQAHFGRQENAFYTSGRLLDHGVIDPRDSRRVIGMALDTVQEGRQRSLRPNAFGVARM
jgi:geranyl-CoA carboxylase beta subunit